MFLMVLLNKYTFLLTSLFAKCLSQGNSLIAFPIFSLFANDNAKLRVHMKVDNEF